MISDAFHWTFTLGDIGTVSALLIAVVGLAWRLRVDVLRFADKLIAIEQRFSDSMKETQAEIVDLKKDVKELTSLLSTIARQDERLNAHARRMDDMSALIAQYHNSAVQHRGTSRPYEEAI